MLDKVEILNILWEGKLKSYDVTASFIQVYYSHPDLPKHSYYVFTFITANQKLIKTEIQANPRMVTSPNKRYKPIIELLVKVLVGDYNGGAIYRYKGK